MIAGDLDLHILVLTEDAGTDVICALAKSALRLIDPAHRADRVDMEPADAPTAEAMQANLWKGRSGKGRQKLVTLARAIARHVFLDRGFVFFHADADRTWSERDKNPSENLQRYRDDVLVDVTRAVDALIATNPGPHDRPAILSRLCLVMPYYAIESWLYQNTAVAKALSHKHYRGRDAGQFDKWERNRGALDDVAKPKGEVCLKSKHNLELASTHFPARAVYEIGKSFAETVDRLEACGSLIEGLASTRAHRSERP